MTEHAQPSGWTAVPHGIWTLPCSDKSKVLLGWLWSHNDAFLQRMSVSEAARQIGWQRTSVRRCLDELRTGGLVEVVAGASGASSTIRLSQIGWQNLHLRIVAGVPHAVDNPDQYG
jgi:hypothetical protein